MGRKFEQKRKAKWVKKKENLVKAYSAPFNSSSIHWLSLFSTRFGGVLGGGCKVRH